MSYFGTPLLRPAPSQRNKNPHRNLSPTNPEAQNPKAVREREPLLTIPKGGPSDQLSIWGGRPSRLVL